MSNLDKDKLDTLIEEELSSQEEVGPVTTSLATVQKSLDSDRKLVNKETFYTFLGLDTEKYDLPLTPEVARRYKSHVTGLRHGMQAVVPLLCSGPLCPIAKAGKCPLVVQKTDGAPDYEATMFPLGRDCPVERDVLRTHIIDLASEYQVTLEDTTDLAIITRIAVLDIYDYRASALLSREIDGTLIIDEVAGSNPRTGTFYYNKKVHPAFELKERIHKMRQDLLKSMVGTRKEKVQAEAKLGTNKFKTDVAKSMSDLRKKIEQLESSKTDIDVIEAEFEEV